MSFVFAGLLLLAGLIIIALKPKRKEDYSNTEDYKSHMAKLQAEKDWHQRHR